MNQNSSEFQVQTLTEIQCDDRWQVYFRLKELDVCCQCGYHQPLTVQVSDAATAVQVWSVVRRVMTPRWQLAQWLETCWAVSLSSDESL